MFKRLLKTPIVPASGPPTFKKGRTFKGHKDLVHGVGISPDGKLLASAGEVDMMFRLTEISSGTQLFTFTHATYLRGVSWSPDGTRLWVSARDGSVFEVSRGAGGGQWSQKAEPVYKHKVRVNLLTYVSAFDLLALPCDDKCLVLVDVKTYKAIQTALLGANPWAVVCNSSGSLLFVGCNGGPLYAFARNGSGIYDKVGEVKAHEMDLRGLALSASGSLLLVGSVDNTASLWRVASPFSSFGTSPSMTFKGHTGAIFGAAFSGDEQFALTGSSDYSVRIWRIADGAEVGRISYNHRVYGLSFHAASGVLAATVAENDIVVSRCAPHIPALPLPAAVVSIDRRVRRPLAAAELSTIQEHISTFDASVRAAADKERSLLEEIASLKDRLATAESELSSIRAPDFVTQLAELAKLLEQEAALVNELSVHDHVLHELEENTRMPACLGYLHNEGFEQWVHDIGLGARLPLLGSLDGDRLLSVAVRDVESLGLSFAESSGLLLRAYVTHYQLSSGPHFVPPGCLVSWDATATSSWLSGLGAPFASLGSLGWTGACLCSLDDERVRGVLDASGLSRLRELVRGQLASEGAPQWAQSWSALAVIGR